MFTFIEFIGAHIPLRFFMLVPLPSPSEHLHFNFCGLLIAEETGYYIIEVGNFRADYLSRTTFLDLTFSGAALSDFTQAVVLVLRTSHQQM